MIADRSRQLIMQQFKETGMLESLATRCGAPTT